MISSHLFQIKTITNLHVGSGDYSYAAVDNTIQRDPTTEIPIIQPSSLKGAIREHCQDNRIEKLNYIFGSDDSAGEYRFLQGEMLALPLRTSRYPYVLGLTVNILENLYETATALNHECAQSLDSIIKEIGTNEFEDDIAYLPGESNTQNLLIEDLPCQSLPECEPLKKFIGEERIAIFNDNTMKKLTSILPVIARNKIGDNGSTENLFYEEVAPRKTIFTFFVVSPETIDQNFYSALTGKPVQIGANASIGYGLTSIKELKNE